MKLARAQVQNFRSVEDSGVFTLDDAITGLVGKNESGKTSLLTALNRVNPILTADKGFNWEHEYPRRFHADYKERHGGKHPTVVTTWWTLEDDDKVAVAEELGPNALTGSEITVTKGYDNIVYWTVPYNEAAIVEHFVNGSELHGEEKAAIEKVTTIAALKLKVTALAEDSPRKAALLKVIAEKAPKETGIALYRDCSNCLSFCCFPNSVHGSARKPLVRANRRRRCCLSRRRATGSSLREDVFRHQRAPLRQEARYSSSSIGCKPGS